MKYLMKLLVLCVFLSSVAFGSDVNWPKKPITLIVPWAVGGLADQTNRAMAQLGEKYFGVPIIPTNKLGAGGIVALTEYMAQRPNSETLIYASEGNFAIAPLFNDVAFTIDNFRPIINIYSQAFVLIANPKTGIKSLDDLKNYAKDHKVTYAVNGLNGSEYMMLTPLLIEMGVDAEAISYEGANQALSAVVAGDATLAVTHLALAKEFVRAEQAQPVLVFDNIPFKDDVYDLRPITEFGYDTFFTNNMMMFAPAGTDDAVAEYMTVQFYKLLTDPEFQAIAKKLQVNINPLDADGVRAHINDTTEKVNRFYKTIQENKK